MHLQGKEIVSQATQRSARTLVASALIVVLAKQYAVLPADLTLLDVKISEAAVAGSIFWVIGFQVVNHFVHWLGDYRSLDQWNSAEKVNGIGRHGAGSHILSKLDKLIETIDVFLDERKADPEHPQGRYPDLVKLELSAMRAELSDLKPSVKAFRTYGAFYFFGWFLILPIIIAFAAMFWPTSPA